MYQWKKYCLRSNYAIKYTRIDDLDDILSFLSPTTNFLRSLLEKNNVTNFFIPELNLESIH